MSVLVGNGDGTFQPAQNFSVGNNPRSIALGDFNGDGLVDVAVTDRDSNDVSILINNTTPQSATQHIDDVALTCDLCLVKNPNALPRLILSAVRD